MFSFPPLQYMKCVLSNHCQYFLSGNLLRRGGGQLSPPLTRLEQLDSLLLDRGTIAAAQNNMQAAALHRQSAESAGMHQHAQASTEPPKRRASAASAVYPPSCPTNAQPSQDSLEESEEVCRPTSGLSRNKSADWPREEQPCSCRHLENDRPDSAAVAASAVSGDRPATALLALPWRPSSAVTAVGQDEGLDLECLYLV